MRKIASLLINELIKLTRRIVLFIGLISLLLIPLLTFINARNNDRFNREEMTWDDESFAEYFISIRQNNVDAIIDQESDPLADGDFHSAQFLESLKLQIETATALQARDPRYLRIAFIDRVIEQRADSQALINVYEAIKERPGDATANRQLADQFLEESYLGTSITEHQKQIATIDALLKQPTIDAYVEFNRSLGFYGFGQSRAFDQQTEALYISLWAQVPNTEIALYDEHSFIRLEQNIEEYIDRYRSLSSGVDRRNFDTVAMTPLLESQIRDEMQILRFQLQNPSYLFANTALSNAPQTHQNAAGQAFNTSFTLNLLVIMVGLMIFAASTISQEIETGTIKTLIISPTKRYKILLAKLFALLIIGLLLFTISVLWIACLSYLFYGSDSLPRLIVVFEGQLLAFKPLGAVLFRLLLSSVQIFVFVLLSVCLSTVIRHTAIAVGLAIGLYLANIIAQIVAYRGAFSELMRWLPFMNIDFAGRIGASMAHMVLGGWVNDQYMHIPPVYSAVYTLLLSGFLLWISFDSFVRRDI